MNNYICFDLETGGLDAQKNPITEFAMIVYKQENFEELFRFECFVKPYDNLVLEKEALYHTGITLEMLENNGIEIDELVELVKEVFQQFTEGKKIKYKPILVGHNIAKFDTGFLEYAFNRNGLNLHDYIEHYKEDTLFIARTKWCGVINKFNLTACCEQAGIQLIDAHRAMNDVEANKQLHEYLIKSLRNSNVQNVGNNDTTTIRQTFQF